ncbi:hypothetical protein PBV87_11480 [Niameybacter massiliensis]|uniref:Uncharacterized protein n=1 Tax=Holtiella tumoricola TaxID=3018743 RepID=A0AA42DNB0_9FIRM|nr:hypothetical protein [Holtiella tumoricola]MDA3732104.1 hypothetical protein [Holtiella tumoricola]
MGSKSFSISGGAVATSSTSTTMDFTKLVNDYNNGLVSDLNGTFSGIGVNVKNVSMGSTVNCNVNSFGINFPVSFTSKYEDTADRNIYKELSVPLNTVSLINTLKQNSNKLMSTITSGTTNFYAPAGLSVTLTTKNVEDFTSATITGKYIDEDIVVTRNTGTGIYIALQQILKDNTTKTIYSKASNTNSVVIPAGTITDIVNSTYKVYVDSGISLESYGDMYIIPTGGTKVYLLSGLSVKTPEISNLAYIGDYWEYPITINWRSENQGSYEYECYYNNANVKSGSGGIDKSFIIPANTFTGTLPSTVRVRTLRTYAGVTYYSDWEEISLRLQDITATISSLNVEGDYWEKPILVSWQSNNQQKFKVEVLKSNVVIKTYTGTTATNYSIPLEELSEGLCVVRVSVAYADRWVNSTERSVTLKDTTAILSDISLSGSNIDLPLTLSWQSTDQQKYEVEIYKDESIVQSYNGTTAISVNIPNNTLTTGLHKFKVRVAYKDRWTEWKEYTATLTETLPSIGVLEPDGVITERDSPIRIWWTSQNQTRWKLVIDGVTTLTGTTEKEYILNAGALTTGTHSMLLTVTYVTSSEIEKPTTKSSEWIVQGKPPIPTITCNDSFQTNRPTITWDTQEQQGYILEVLNGEKVIYSTDWENGLVTVHKINDYLENGIYTVRVKIMNQFNLESDYGNKQITINANVNEGIALEAIQCPSNVMLTWDNPGNVFEKFYIIRNGEVVGKTEKTTYIDFSAWGELIYHIRGITSNDTFKDSNQVYSECNINNAIICTIDRLEDIMEVGIMRDKYSFSRDIYLESEEVFLTGRISPVTIFGEHKRNTYALSFVSSNVKKFIEMCNRKQVFLYRDRNFKAYVTVSSITESIDKFGIQYTCDPVEVDYSEVIKYD